MVEQNDDDNAQNKSNKSNDSKGSSKFDLKDLVGNIKSMLGQDGTPEAVSGDALGEQMKQISETAQQLAEKHAEMTNDLHQLNHQVNGLFQAIETFRTIHAIGMDSATDLSEKKQHDSTTTTRKSPDSNQPQSSSKKDDPKDDIS